MTLHVPIRTLWVATLYDGDGPDAPIMERWTFSNFLTALGEAHLAARQCASPPAAMSHLAVGTGTGQTAASTTLANEIARVALDSGYPQQGTGAADNEVLYLATLPVGTGTGTLTEFAIFNASSGGTMLNYASGFAPKIKGAGQSLGIGPVYMRLGVT